MNNHRLLVDGNGETEKTTSLAVNMVAGLNVNIPTTRSLVQSSLA
jgi:hypothetical protein